MIGKKILGKHEIIEMHLHYPKFIHAKMLQIKKEYKMNWEKLIYFAVMKLREKNESKH